jgi:uncharacterized protein with HEPN domain
MEKDKKYLSDILLAIDLIESFTADTETFDQYQSDIKTQSAIERQLSILGEAVNKIKQEYPDESLNYVKEIIGFRNRIIHAYDAIDNSIV